MPKYIKIAVNGPFKKSFTYLYPDTIGSLAPGQRVLVPFGKKQIVGFYLGQSKPVKNIRIKEIIKVLDNNSLFSEELFKFCLWISDYYFANPADCLSSAIPSLFKKKLSPKLFWTDKPYLDLSDEIEPLYKSGKKISKAVENRIKTLGSNVLNILIKEQIIIEKYPEVSDDSNTGETKSGNAVLLDFIQPKKDIDKIKLNSQQRDAVEKIKSDLNSGFNVTLLHGVTGSGKTIVYCHLCREVVSKGKTALVLTPEIALTSTTLAYFRGFFGDEVTVIHSAMTEKERLESYQGIRNGKYRIVLGPRSALFAPLTDIGLIIVDEEHDSSYKQDDPAPRFHGRDSAVMRAKINDVSIILGSASPSLESYYNAASDRYKLIELTERPGKAVLPTVQIVDMRHDRLKGDLPYLSYTLKKEVDERIKKNEQVILFLNRRGHSSQLKCPACGYVPNCPNCQVKLTYHRAGKKLSCHYCDHQLTGYDSCSNCGQTDILYIGVGTQKVEDNIPRLFEGALPIRLDSDSAAGRTRAYEILTEFADKKHNMLLGTQMVTKGLDLPDVTLVGVLSADMSLDLPDFRASERAFARLLQVAGRSGRSEQRGEVLIQTFYPEHEVINDAAAQDYKSFYEKEIKSREQLFYPPYSRIINFVLLSEDEQLVEKTSKLFKEALHKKLTEKKIVMQLLGPAPCPMYYLRNKYRRHLFVKTNQVMKVVRLLTEWEDAQANFKLPSKVRLNIDVDPDDMM